MADNKVNFLRGTSAEYEASAKDNDTFYYTTDDEKLYLGDKEITGGGVTIDDTLSDTSNNPVQNKIVKMALDNKANLSDIPTELPANGGNADTVDGKHASDFTLSYIRNNKPLVTSILPLEKTARLTWLPVDGATAYAVYLYIDGKYVTQSTSITNTYYDIQGLTPGTVYLALVRACVNDSWSSFNTDDLVHFYTLPVASATSDGLVTRSSQTFAGYKTFQNNVYIQHSEYTKSSTAPSTTQFKAYRFSDNANKQMGEFSNYVDTNNNTVSKMLAVAATSLDGKIYSQIATLINADASYICHVCTTPTTGRSSLRQMASGTADATTSNCPSGAWYGKHS